MERWIGYGVIVLVGILILALTERRRQRAAEARYRAHYPAGALIDDAARAGKLGEAGGMEALVQRVALADDPTAEVAKLREELGVPAVPAGKPRARDVA
ncbi:hypothetical protein [Cupriavidus sp. TMH.W2]|uniref:hypothetical protein n=1 Tax=Cupriavidus sp. TMH.W2 TaxID=3434465 RepID=UPI003D7775CB